MVDLYEEVKRQQERELAQVLAKSQIATRTVGSQNQLLSGEPSLVKVSERQREESNRMYEATRELLAQNQLSIRTPSLSSDQTDERSYLTSAGFFQGNR
ncbi:MAG: hypothetical protein Q7R76_03540 [Candidatus Woesearchaeota archaeon]|nr:hypothetical protein [Candidatus Woesearchaeota archaeon]